MASFVRDDNNNKKWMVRWESVDDTGVHHHKKRGFLSKKEAQNWYMVHCQEEKKTSGDDMLFDDLIEAFLVYHRHRVKESSYVQNVNRIDQKIRPAFLGVKVTDITPLMILKWQESLCEYSYRYQISLRTTLKSILRYGFKYHDLPNVMDKVDRPRNLESKQEMVVWSPEEFKTFYVALTDSTLRMYFKTLYLLGCRKGEAQALQWRDIDLPGAEIHICHTYIDHTMGSGWKLQTPKTKGSDRKIVISPSLRDSLTQYKSTCTHTDPEDFVFGGAAPYSSSKLQWHFAKALKKSGVKVIRMHDIRHSCASYLLSQGLDIVTVSKRLGHSSVKQTLDTYAHVMPSSEDRLNSIIESMATDI